MKISTRALHKVLAHQVIFTNFTYQFASGQTYGIAGSNGSGKSTLLKTLCGFISPTQGTLEYLNSNHSIKAKDIYKYVSYCAPYIQLPEQFTVQEYLSFIFKLKGSHETFNINTDIGKHIPLDSKLTTLSSGMLQRIKCIAALASKSPVLFFDEPTTNFDLEAKHWFEAQLQKFGNGRLVCIASNEPFELNLCNERIKIENYKN